MARTNPAEHARALQEYLEAIAEEHEMPSRRNRQLLLSYAELQFKLRGGSQCAVCRASVRHVLPVKVERLDGQEVDYSCLCTRCIEAEKSVARKVILKIGEATVEHVANSAKQRRASGE
jgi:bacterioferritin-associated ferredoxin